MRENIFGSILKELRKANKVNQTELADRLGVSRSAISTWETGANEPDTQTLLRIANFFDVSVSYLLGETTLKKIEQIPLEAIFKKTLYVYESIGAGGGKILEQEPVGTVQAIDGDFAVKVRGDSMLPVPDGAVAVVKKVYNVREIKSGTLVVVRINSDEGVLKYWEIEDNYGVILRSENIHYKPKFYPFEAFYNGECELIGVAIQIIIDTSNMNYYNQ